MAFKASKFAWSMFMNKKTSDTYLINLLANRPVGNSFVKNEFHSHAALYSHLDELSKKTYVENLAQSRLLQKSMN